MMGTHEMIKRKKKKLIEINSGNTQIVMRHHQNFMFTHHRDDDKC